MKKKEIILIGLGLLLSQVIVLPFLGNIDKAAKLYFFSFFLFFLYLNFLFKHKKINLSPVSHLFFFIFISFSLFYIDSYYKEWTLLIISIFFLYILYLYYVINYFSNDINLYEIFLDIFLVLAVFLSSFGLYEYIYYISVGPKLDMLIPFFLPQNLSSRVGGIYGQPNLFSLFMSLSIFLFFFKYIHSYKYKINKNIFILKYIPFCLVCTVFFLTQSRSGFISFSAILLFVLWMVFSGRYLNNDMLLRKEFYFLLLCVIVSFFISKLVYYSPDTGELSNQAFRQITFSGGKSIETRFIYWTSAILIFLDHPWTGIGLDNFQFLMNSYGPKSHAALGFVEFESMKSTVWAHNELLQLACEGGLIVLIFLLLLLSVFGFSFWHQFIRNKNRYNPIFLYSHLFLLPFLFQSMFSWPLRSPPLLLLFFTFTGGLLAQYKCYVFYLGKRLRWFLAVLFIVGLIVVTFLFVQEIKIGTFNNNLGSKIEAQEALGEFEKLVSNPYSEYRLLFSSLDYFAQSALQKNDSVLLEKIIPYYEKLCKIDGNRWHWFRLAQLYLQTERETDARIAIQSAIDLMPLEQTYWDLLHHLNVLKASRATGRTVESFYPQGASYDFKKLELN